MYNSSFTSENESISEVETLKQQLNTYKMINGDLSKKIQELKVELNFVLRENTQIRQEVLDERAKSAEYRQYFMTINTQCMNFVNTYVASMQQISEKNVTLIEGIPALADPNRSVNLESPTNSTVVPNVEKQRHSTIRSQLHSAHNVDDNTGNNALNTIVEESILPFTSTPIVPNRQANGPADLIQQITFNGFSPSISSPNISEHVMETPKIQANPSSRRISIVSQDDHQEETNKENETDGDDTTEQSLQHNTIKECRVAISPLKSAYLQSLDNNNSESPNSESYEEEETIKNSQDSQSDSKITRAPKRKSSEGRPRRRARPDANALKEPSLRAKLRRSKKKI